VTIDELRKARDRRPFVPFVIRMSDGKDVTVRHPENLAWDEATGIAVCLSEDGTDVIDVDLVTSLRLGVAGKKGKK
jgi:hypothetical protein